jgi:putative ABC transport system ATP-binding protein
VGESLLVLRGVSRGFDAGFGWLRVLAGVSLSLGEGEIGAVLASRDQGKTTLLRMAAGMLLADEGEVRFDGRDLKAMSEGDRARLLGSEIAWACRDGPGGLRLEAVDYVGLPLVAGYGLRGREPVRRAYEALEWLGVQECARLTWQQLSGWQRVGVELAQAIVARPRLLLVDDLIDGLSMGRTREAMRLIRSLVAEFGFGVLMGVSDGESAMLADRVWVLDEGELASLEDEETDEQQTTVIDLHHPRRRGSKGMM